MAASFPSSKKTFSQVVNGITKLVALLFNSNYDETEALQTYLGAAGNAQTKLVALNRLFKYMGAPLPKIAWIDADTIEIEACSVAMHSGNNYVFKENTSALQIKLSVDLDTGSEASSTWYDVYLVGDGASSTYTAKFVLQGNTPSGATYYKKIFAVLNDGSSNLVKFTHLKDYIDLDAPIDITSTPSSGSWSSAISCATAIPAISTRAKFNLSVQCTNNYQIGMSIRPNGGTGITPNLSGTPIALISGFVGMIQQVESFTDSSQQIQHYEAAAGGSISTILISVQGYYLNLR